MTMRFPLALIAMLALSACDEGTIHVVRFPGGKIREMWKEKGPAGKPTVRDGEYQSFYPDGRRESLILYKGGKKNGSGRRWDGQGRLSGKSEFSDDFLVRDIRIDSFGTELSDRKFTLKTAKVKAVGSAGDSLEVAETCAWSSHAGGEPVRDGLCTMTYDDGRTMATRFFKEGRLHGPVKAWYQDGTPWLEGAYVMDIPTGKWRTWTRSGNLLWSAGYINGERQGAWDEWFPDGQPKSKSRFRKGKPEGGYQEWYPTGKTRLRGSYSEGRRQGQEDAWYPDGSRLYCARYAAGKLEGDFFQWHPGGKLRLHCRFSKGRKDGLSRVWYPAGGLQEQASYKAGRLDGSYRTWAADGLPMAMKEFRNGAVAFDSKAKELLDLLGADQLRVPVGMMGFYWGMGLKECRANLGLYQASDVRAGADGLAANLIAFPDRSPTQARIRLAFNGQGELWGIKLELMQKSSSDFFPMCENLEVEIGAELGTAGLRRADGESQYYMTRKRDWGKFTVTTGSAGAAGGIQQDLPVVSAEGFSPGEKGWFRFALENSLYREYVNPANAAITPPRWEEEALFAGR